MLCAGDLQSILRRHNLHSIPFERSLTVISKICPHQGSIHETYTRIDSSHHVFKRSFVCPNAIFSVENNVLLEIYAASDRVTQAKG